MAITRVNPLMYGNWKIPEIRIGGDTTTGHLPRKSPPVPYLEEGSLCPVCKAGYMQIEQDPCYCGTVPAPCPACKNSWLECDNCNLTEEEIMTNNHENPINDEFDVITLLQIDEGARLVKTKGINRTTGKPHGKALTFKTVMDDLQDGDGVLVRRGDGGLEVRIVCDSEEDTEQQVNVTYQWIVDRVDMDKIRRYSKLDNEIRKRISRGKAIEAARAALGEMNKDIKLIPNGDS